MVIPSENIFLNKSFSEKEEVIKYISLEAQNLNYTNSAEDLYEVFKEREDEYSTGLQEGFSIPHAKSHVVNKAGIIYVRSDTDIEWETYDDQGVTDVFALLVPEEGVGKIHLKMLSNLATALLDDEFKNNLRSLCKKNDISEFITNKIGETVS
jgi:PTS system fructose-specific IIA component